MVKVYIDADACPVKEQVYKVSIRHGLEVNVVSNGGIRPHPHPLINIKIVDEGLDAADDWIADNANSSDLVITDDIPLAARSIKNGVIVLKSDGMRLDGSNIGSILANRNLMTEIRSADPFFQGRGKKFSNSDRSNFLNALEKEARIMLLEKEK